MSDECQAGCMHYTGGEVRHHKDCVFYPESLTKMYDDLQSRITSLESENRRLGCDFRYVKRQWRATQEGRDKALERITSLEERCEGMRAALEFYADDTHWLEESGACGRWVSGIGAPCDPSDPDFDVDWGAMARHTLAKFGGKG